MARVKMKNNLGPLKILVIDDDRALRQNIVSYLKEQQCLVVEAESGSEAWEILKVSRYDLVITDVQMAFGDGIWVLAKITTEGPIVPVIMMTGGASVTREHALSLGAAELLTKPFSTKALRDSIIRCCGS
jgi:two-component system, response regulator FlrC